MTTRTSEIEVYENDGALLTLGPSRVLDFSDFSTPQTGTLAVDNTQPKDREWDFGENATFDGAPATLLATGTAFAGVTVRLLGVNLLTLQLSTPVNVAVFSANGSQYLKFYNDDGSDADPAELLDALAVQLVDGLSNLPAVGLLLRPLVNNILRDPLTFLQQNALLTFNLTAGEGLPLVPCFTAGTMIMTRNGEVPVETLRVGDHVLTVDNGFRPIRWIGGRGLSAAELVAAPHLRPIRIAAGALGCGLPYRDLRVSPQHRCLIRSDIAQQLVGDREVLVAAKHLTDFPGVSMIERPEGVTYVHLLFDQHELVFSDGAITESFYLGPVAVASVDQAARDEIIELFPEVALGRSLGKPQAVRQFLSGAVARKLVQRARAQDLALVEPAASAMV